MDQGTEKNKTSHGYIVVAAVCSCAREKRGVIVSVYPGTEVPPPSIA